MWPAPTYHKHPSATLRFGRHKLGVYAIINSSNGKIYIGSAACLSRRWATHRSYLSKKRHHSRELQKDFDLCPENFQICLIEDIQKTEILRSREKFWMDFYRSYDPRFGYNKQSLAGSNLGFRHTQATKDKVSSSNSGKKRTPEQNARQSARQMGVKGKPLSTEMKALLLSHSVGSKRTREAIEAGLETRRKNKKGWIPVIQMDLNGNEIARFDSVQDANRAMGRTRASAINQVFAGMLKTAFGFKWRKA